MWLETRQQLAKLNPIDLSSEFPNCILSPPRSETWVSYCRACFKKNSLLHILRKIFWTTIFTQKHFNSSLKIFSIHPSKFLITFLVIDHKRVIYAPSILQMTFLHVLPLGLPFDSSCIRGLFFLNSSLQNSHSSLHISFITAHFVHHCTLKQALSYRTENLRRPIVARHLYRLSRDCFYQLRRLRTVARSLSTGAAATLVHSFVTIHLEIGRASC